MKKSKNIILYLTLVLLTIILVTGCKGKEEKNDLANEKQKENPVENILNLEEKDQAKTDQALEEGDKEAEDLEEDKEAVSIEDFYGIWKCIYIPPIEGYNPEDFVEELRIRLDQTDFYTYAYRTSFVNSGPYKVLSTDEENKIVVLEVREESFVDLDYFNENPEIYYDENRYRNLETGEIYEEVREIQIFSDQIYELQVLEEDKLGLRRPDGQQFIYEYLYGLDSDEFF
ncbi:MAG: hypothetical protein Q4E36_06440 [Bacillota bacterium]|nr:hypothetical protein [Bacillota bacterium]